MTDYDLVHDKLPLSIFEINYFKLKELEPNLFSKLTVQNYLIFKTPNHMDLKIDLINSTSHYFDISMCHNIIENGDLVPDPEFLLRIYSDHRIVEVIQYQDKFGGRKVYFSNSTFDSNAKIELNKYLNQWINELCKKGYYHYSK